MKRNFIIKLLLVVLISICGIAYAATDNYSTLASGLDSPVKSGAAITPHDTNELSFVTRAIYVGGAGNIVVLLADDSSTVTFTGVQAGQLLPIRAKKVLSTNTTATSLLALN